jgi:hypothetical protein
VTTSYWKQLAADTLTAWLVTHSSSGGHREQLRTSRWLLRLLLLKLAVAQLSFVHGKALTSDLPLTAPPYLSA